MRVQATGLEAVPEAKASIRAWIESKVFQDTARAFGWTDNPDQDLDQRIDDLVAQSDEWDFRRRTAKAESMGTTRESTRWTSHGQLLSAQQVALANRAGSELKLACASMPSRDQYRAVLVLGGARLSCLLRTEWAGQILREGVKTQDVVLLGSQRPVADSERDATDTYAPEAATEFDLFVAAGSVVFGFDKDVYSGQRHEDAHPNLSWEVREYSPSGLMRVLIISAPSGEPSNRRSNSADTYKFYISRHHIRPGDWLLLVTSPIYVPYQQLEAIRVITVPLGIHVETVGFPPEWRAELQGMQGPQHYLQEMRSFLQSAQRFLTAFPA